MIQVPLTKSYPNVMVTKAQLKDAVQTGNKAGCDGTRKTVLRNFVNKLLLAIYPISYLANHSLSGKSAPKLAAGNASSETTDDGNTDLLRLKKAKKVKDGLPQDVVAAILGTITADVNKKLIFCIHYFFSSYLNRVCDIVLEKVVQEGLGTNGHP